MSQGNKHCVQSASPTSHARPSLKCACRGSCVLESDVKFQFGPLLSKTESSNSCYSDSPTPKYVVVARMVPTYMCSVHGTIYPFTQGFHSDSADCSSNVFMAEASRPFESCVLLVFVLMRCFRLSLTCAILPFL